MTCREFIEFLWVYLSEVMSEDRRLRFDAHLTVCPSCVAYLKSYVETQRLGREALDPDAPLPADVPEDLVRAILAAR